MKAGHKIAKGFLSLEYAMLIAILVAILVGMSAYIRDSLSSRWREAADSFGHGRQYDPQTTITNEPVTPVIPLPPPNVLPSVNTTPPPPPPDDGTDWPWWGWDPEDPPLPSSNNATENNIWIDPPMNTTNNTEYYA